MWQDYLDKAESLINSGYPVPTDDVVKLAKLLFEKSKHINSNVSRGPPSH
jgi:hypothetical protein